MTTSAAKKTRSTQKKTSTLSNKKAVPQPRKTLARKAPATAQRSQASNTSAQSSRHATVEDSEDDETTHVGAALDSDGDMIMEENDDASVGADPNAIDISDDENGEEAEDEESELRASAIHKHVLARC